MKPWLQKKAKEFDGRAIIVAIDADRTPEVFEEYGVSLMPTFVLIKNGEEIDRLEGADKDRLQSMLDESAKAEAL